MTPRVVAISTHPFAQRCRISYPPRVEERLEIAMKTIAEVPWTSIAGSVAEGLPVLLPVGASEVYGPHIPNGTDGLAAIAPCRAAAQLSPALITPLVPVGCSGHLVGFPGTLSVSSKVLKGYVEGVIESLVTHGASNFVVVNGHAGNVSILIELLYEAKTRYGIRAAHIDLWRFIQPLSADIVESVDYPYGHGAGAITSVMLHLHPELMDTERAVRTSTTPSAFPEINTIRNYCEVADTGVIGDATLGSAEKARIIFERAVERLAAYLKSIKQASLEAA